MEGWHFWSFINSFCSPPLCVFQWHGPSSLPGHHASLSGAGWPSEEQHLLQVTRQNESLHPKGSTTDLNVVRQVPKTWGWVLLLGPSCCACLIFLTFSFLFFLSFPLLTSVSLIAHSLCVDSIHINPSALTPWSSLWAKVESDDLEY